MATKRKGSPNLVTGEVKKQALAEKHSFSSLPDGLISRVVRCIEMEDRSEFSFTSKRMHAVERRTGRMRLCFVKIVWYCTSCYISLRSSSGRASSWTVKTEECDAALMFLADSTVEYMTIEVKVGGAHIRNSIEEIFSMTKCDTYDITLTDAYLEGNTQLPQLFMIRNSSSTSVHLNYDGFNVSKIRDLLHNLPQLDRFVFPWTPRKALLAENFPGVKIVDDEMLAHMASQCRALKAAVLQATAKGLMEVFKIVCDSPAGKEKHVKLTAIPCKVFKQFRADLAALPVLICGSRGAGEDEFFEYLPTFTLVVFREAGNDGNEIFIVKGDSEYHRLDMKLVRLLWSGPIPDKLFEPIGWMSDPEPVDLKTKKPLLERLGIDSKPTTSGQLLWKNPFTSIKPGFILPHNIDDSESSGWMREPEAKDQEDQDPVRERPEHDLDRPHHIDDSEPVEVLDAEPTTSNQPPVQLAHTNFSRNYNFTLPGQIVGKLAKKVNDNKPTDTSKPLLPGCFLLRKRDDK